MYYFLTMSHPLFVTTGRFIVPFFRTSVFVILRCLWVYLPDWNIQGNTNWQSHTVTRNYLQTNCAKMELWTQVHMACLHFTHLFIYYWTDVNEYFGGSYIIAQNTTWTQKKLALEFSYKKFYIKVGFANYFKTKQNLIYCFICLFF